MVAAVTVTAWLRVCEEDPVWLLVDVKLPVPLLDLVCVPVTVGVVDDVAICDGVLVTVGV